MLINCIDGYAERCDQSTYRVRHFMLIPFAASLELAGGGSFREELFGSENEEETRGGGGEDKDCGNREEGGKTCDSKLYIYFN